MKFSLKTIIIGIVIVLVLGGAYLYFFSSSVQSPVTATTPASADQQQFLDLAAELSPISFNTAIFSDPRFTSLVDITVPITPDQQGRPDPFAPIPGVTSGH
jgi:flagellar basal body-associated protein FliL